MGVLHLFVCSGRFNSFEEMRSFIDPTYTEDGDMMPSEFMKEVKLEEFEPTCIEAFWEPQPRPLSELLHKSSCAEQWLSQVDPSLSDSQAICVFEPNQLREPTGTSLRYCGSYRYDPQDSVELDRAH